MKVGDLVKVTAVNGAGCNDNYVTTGTVGVITRIFGDRFNKGPGWEEIMVATAGIGTPATYYASSWSVIPNLDD